MRSFWHFYKRIYRQRHTMNEKQFNWPPHYKKKEKEVKNFFWSKKKVIYLNIHMFQMKVKLIDWKYRSRCHFELCTSTDYDQKSIYIHIVLNGNRHESSCIYLSNYIIKVYIKPLHIIYIVGLKHFEGPIFYTMWNKSLS